MDEAVREAKAGADNDPLSPWVNYQLADVLLSAGQYDAAARYCALSSEFGFANECMGRARLAQGRAADAIQFLISSPTNNWGYLAYAYTRAGRR
jgi:predicted Zn-dependent protease